MEGEPAAPIPRQHHNKLPLPLSIIKQVDPTSNTTSPATSLSSDEDASQELPASPDQDITPPASPSPKKATTYVAPHAIRASSTSSSSSYNHTNNRHTMSGPVGLLVSPEVMFGRLRIVSEAEEEGGYSQSSANESGWSEFADDDDTDQESDYDVMNTSNLSFISHSRDDAPMS